MINDKPEQYEQLIQLVRDTIQRDAGLRDKYQVGDKFRFVRDRLNGLLVLLEAQAKTVVAEQQEEAKAADTSDEELVYVYLYNAQGIQLRSWINFMTAKVFYEYSVNRPIYTKKQDIEALLRSKTNKAQHGYLIVSIKRHDMLKEGAPVKDSLGSTLLKVKEGSLHFHKLVSFHHNGEEYTLSEQNEFIKK